MNLINYLDGYTIIFEENFSAEQIYSSFYISKSKQKLYPIEDGMITFPLQEWKPKCEQKELEIIYEDETLLVVNKPAFILVHSDGNDEENMQDYVNAYLYDSNWPHPAQAIHRLDRETSGLLLFCKNPFFQAYYDDLFANKHPKKEYYALVKKNFPFKQKEVHSSIGRDRHDARKMRVSETGKESHTFVKRIQMYKNSSLLSIQILTGRKHQIRVHLSSLGFPIINDPLYGEVINKSGLMLQHYKISFPLPTGNFLKLELPIDQRIQNFIGR